MNDLISRQAAIDAPLEAYPDNMDVEFILGKLPSAQPERKKGYWIAINESAGLYECDQCHERVCCVGKYCMNCGARMEEQE